jgi:hypothetical protein
MRCESRTSQRVCRKGDANRERVNESVGKEMGIANQFVANEKRIANESVAHEIPIADQFRENEMRIASESTSL